MQLCDVHCHFFSSRFLEVLSQGIPDLPETGRAAAVSHRVGWNDPGTVEELADRWVAELDRHGVSRVALIASVPGDEASVAAAVRRHPARFVGFFMFNPLPGRRQCPVCRSCWAAADCAASASSRRCMVIGWTTSGCGMCLRRQHRRTRWSSRTAACSASASGKSSVCPRHSTCVSEIPLALAATAARFPAVKVIVPHFGAGLLRELLMAAEQCPNIHLDTSSSNGWIRSLPGPDARRRVPPGCRGRRRRARDLRDRLVVFPARVAAADLCRTAGRDRMLPACPMPIVRRFSAATSSDSSPSVLADTS